MIKKFFLPKKSKDNKEKDHPAEQAEQVSVDNSLAKKRFGLWGNLPLSGKLLMAFGALFMFAVIIATMTLIGLNRTQAAYENALAQGIEMRNLSGKLATNLLKARDDEKNFLLNWRTQGYYTAYANYVTRHTTDVAQMRENLNQLTPFGSVAATLSTGSMSQIQYEADVATLTQNVNAYEKSFTALVNAYHKKGFDEDTDFESQFRTAAVNMEANLFYGQQGVDQIKITYLQLRFGEKKYLTDANPAYAVEIHSFIPLLKDQIATTANLEPKVKADLLKQIDDYLTAFDALVALDNEVTVHNKELLTAAGAVETQAAKIEELGNQLAADRIASARSNYAQTYTNSLIAIAVVLVLTILISITFSAQITRPIRALTNTAQQISSGSFDVQAKVSSGDEVGALANAFNNMTAQLRSAFQNLDRRAHELGQQTLQLELTSAQNEKHSRQLQTIAEIARYISTEKDLYKLLPLITQIVSERFGFYHVGIFLLDDTGTNAVLLASNSSGGQKMLQRHHSLKVGQVGIVGNVAATGIPRIASDIGEDAIYFNNPDLPQTRSELALPLKVEKRVIGALDIQSAETNAFSNDDVEVLIALADQVSIAIQNARLLNDVEKALAESNAIQHQYLRETWKKLPQEEKLSGYRYSIAGAVPLGNEAELAIPENNQGGQAVNVPIILRGETIGTLSVQVPKDGQITADQLDLIKAVAERVALSAENARLFGETTRRAEHERIISDIVSKIGTSVRTENILRTTAIELSHVLEDADIFINLGSNNNNGKEGAE